MHRNREDDFSRSSRGVGAPSRTVEGAYAKLGVPAGRRLSQRRRGSSLCCGKLCRRRRRPKPTEAKRRGRPRKAHAAAHIRMVIVDVPSSVDQPLELRLLVLVYSMPHIHAHRVAHRARRALRARSDTCGFGGTRAARLTLAREAARAQSRCAGSSPTGPSELGWRRQPGREGASRTFEATATPGSRSPEQVAWLCEAGGEPRPRTWAKQGMGQSARARARHAAELTSVHVIEITVDGRFTEEGPCVKRSVKSLFLVGCTPLSPRRASVLPPPRQAPRSRFASRQRRPGHMPGGFARSRLQRAVHISHIYVISTRSH